MEFNVDWAHLDGTILMLDLLLIMANCRIIKQTRARCSNDLLEIERSEITTASKTTSIRVTSTAQIRTESKAKEKTKIMTEDGSIPEPAK